MLLMRFKKSFSKHDELCERLLFFVIEILLLFLDHVALYINMYHHFNDAYCACHWLI